MTGMGVWCPCSGVVGACPGRDWGRAFPPFSRHVRLMMKPRRRDAAINYPRAKPPREPPFRFAFFIRLSY
jgi:hypothetical protein